MGNFATLQANAWLNAFTNATDYAGNAAVWVKLHTGAPGSAGTSNAATNTTRQQATFGTPASAGAIANTAAVEWTNVSTTETYSHISLWTASSNGTFLGSDQLSADAVMTAGDTFRIAIGALTLSVATVV